MPDALPLTLSRRRWLAALAGASTLGATGLAAARPRQPRSATAALPKLRLLAHGSLPTGTEFKGTLVGGLSGLSWDPATNLWYALSDDRSRHAPARVYVFRLPAPADGQPFVPQWVDVITLRGPDGQPYPRHSVDPEALALRRDAATGQTTLLWTSEGDIRARIPPSLQEVTLEGRWLRSFKLPRQLTEIGRLGRGPRHNDTLEGLALTPDGRHVWAAMEGALNQDGDHLTPGAPPGLCRITRLDLVSGEADRQIAYLPEARPFGPLMPQGSVESGISEILMPDPDHLWVLERAWHMTTGVSARLYEVDLTRAANTLTIDALRPRRTRAAPKRLILDLRQSGLPHIDNFEAMAWGSTLPGGQRCLVLCTDDNFNPLQVTQFAAFEVA